jgi:hypothetical protein
MNARTIPMLAWLCLSLGACDSGSETGPTVRRAVQLQVVTGVPLHVTSGELLGPRTVRAAPSGRAGVESVGSIAAFDLLHSPREVRV